MNFGTIRTAAALAVLAATTATACDTALPGRDRSCVPVEIAISPDKVDLLGGLAGEFNRSREARSAAGGTCAAVRIQKVSSGVATDRLANGWPADGESGPKPAAWSPSASTWGAVLTERLRQQGQSPLTAQADALFLTPLVIAMPRPMAEALGWPAARIGYADILALAQDPSGWAAKGHAEWGPFRLGKTNPNFSTSALSSTIAQYYAATGKTSGLTNEDLDRPAVATFARGVESAVVHYGDITLTFLNNWYRNDARGSALTYASALAVEEKSVIEYNRGNPDGILDAGEQPRPPRIPLVAIYPKEGTLFSDHPFYVLDAPWVTDAQREAAGRFEDYVRRPESQRQALAAGFRPGNPDVGVSDPIVAGNGVDPAEPRTTLAVPEPAVLLKVIRLWNEQRKPARVLFVVDVSGSMGDPGGARGLTKLDLAKEAVIAALGQFKSDDQVALRIFSTDIGKAAPTDYADLVPFGPVGEQRETMVRKIQALAPANGTPLYTVTRESHAQLRASYDPARINAIVLLTDGRNEDPRNSDAEGLLDALRAASEGQGNRPVRIFTIAYGQNADRRFLQQVAEATNAAAYDAGEPKTIDKVFASVVSNF